MCSPDGKLVAFIKHPLDEDRLLFFGFDYTQILKNIRNLQADRVFDICGQTVSFKLLRREKKFKKISLSFVPTAIFKHTLTNTQIQTPWTEWKCLWCVQWRTHCNIQTVQEIRRGGFYKRSKCKCHDHIHEAREHVFFQIHDVHNTTQHIRSRTKLRIPLVSWVKRHMKRSFLRAHQPQHASAICYWNVISNSF